MSSSRSDTEGYVWLSEREAIAAEIALDRFANQDPERAAEARAARVRITEMIRRHWPHNFAVSRNTAPGHYGKGRVV